MRTMDWTNTIEEWHAHGLLCRIKPGGYSLNGYVQIPGDLPPGADIDDARVELSYGPDADGWIGFHTGHGWDYWETEDLAAHLPVERVWVAVEHRRMAMSLGADSHRWTRAELRTETEQLAQRIAAALGLTTG
ncbi:hypothetical protein ACIRLA_46565 [Streptomyces sp. NPDC102364]|uniref:hypothetical protein n=1 Tax=Streptomyces sp. NPDC102364 TaxID=3366161 RepID=UPI00380BC08F